MSGNLNIRCWANHREGAIRRGIADVAVERVEGCLALDYNGVEIIGENPL